MAKKAKKEETQVHTEENIASEVAAENVEVALTEAATEATGGEVETLAGEAPAKEKKAKRAPPPREPKHAPTGIITLGADDKGVKYGAENNPKKAGSASAKRFALYRDGMTVAEAKEVGLNGSDLDYDSDPKRNFITLS